MRDITIYCVGDTVRSFEGKKRGAQRTWTVTSQLDVYILTGFNDNAFEMAQLLACYICQDMHIPLSQLRLVDKPRKGISVKRHVNSRLLF